MAAKSTVIFLDIDGVLTSNRTGWYNWDVYAVSFLRYACEKSGAKIVISSTWRCNRDRKFFSDVFGDEIVHKDWRTYYDLSDFDVKCRGQEIAKWLESHPEIWAFVIVDDDVDMLPEQMPCLVRTDTVNGLLMEDMVKIHEMLGLGRIFNVNHIPVTIRSNMFSKCELPVIETDVGGALTGITFTRQTM